MSWLGRSVGRRNVLTVSKHPARDVHAWSASCSVFCGRDGISASFPAGLYPLNECQRYPTRAVGVLRLFLIETLCSDRDSSTRIAYGRDAKHRPGVVALGGLPAGPGPTIGLAQGADRQDPRAGRRNTPYLAARASTARRLKIIRILIAHRIETMEDFNRKNRMPKQHNLLREVQRDDV